MPWLYFCCLTLLMNLQTNGQGNVSNFFTLSEKDGLSYNVVNCFLKGSKGDLWIGTYNGFNRFDGTNFYTYKIRKGLNSIPSEVVHSLCEDRQGNIWGATDNGIFRYNPAKDTFVNYTIKNLNNSSIFFEILTDQNGEVWVAGLWSIFRYQPKTDRWVEVVRLIDDPDSLNTFRISKNGFMEDYDGNGFWLATSSGLVYYDKSRHRIMNSRTHSGNPLFKRQEVLALSKSANNLFWFYDKNSHHIIQFDPDKKEIKKTVSLKEYTLNTMVNTLFEDREQRVWLCTWGYDMLLIESRDNSRITRVYHKDEDGRSIASTFFWDVMEDEDGTLWFGTMAGISRCNMQGDIYKQLNVHEDIPLLNKDPIYKVIEDEATGYWIITRTNNLIRHNLVTRKYQSFDLSKAIPKTNGDLPGFINSIQRIRNEWVISTYTGSWTLNRSTNRWHPYGYLPEGYQNFRCSEIQTISDSIYFFNNGREWLYWNTNSKVARLLTYEPDSEMPVNRTIIGSSLKTRSNQIWFISYNGCIGYIDDQMKLKRIRVFDPEADNSASIAAIDEDSKGHLYIAVKGKGLYQYNKSNGQLRFWNEPDGMPGNRVHHLVVDNRDRVWMMIYNKVCVYISATNRFINFKIPYSESNYYYTNNLYEKRDGNILGTIHNEVFEFFTSRLLQKPLSRNPLISSLVTDKGTYHLPFHHEVSLRPYENTLRFYFGTTILNDIYPFDMEYKLSGTGNAWTLAGASGNAVYNNLSPGSYEFRVRVRSKHNNWQSEESVVRFQIMTPFLKSKLFYSLLIFLLTGIAMFIFRYRMQQRTQFIELERKAQLLEKEKALVMYENLKQQLNPHFLFNSLTSLNSLIQIDPKAANTFLENLSKTYRYILKSRDTETVTLLDEIKSAEYYINLQRIRFENGFDVQIDVDKSFHNHKIVPVTIQNLIENAIKHNVIDTDNPLVIRILVENEMLVVRNNLQRKKFVETSNKQGLTQMISLYAYLSQRPMQVIESATDFIVLIPLI